MTTIRHREEGDPLRIVCTDRRDVGGHVGHKRTHLAEYWGGGRLSGRYDTTSVMSPGQHKPEGPLSTVSTETRQFYCPRCRRNPKVDDDLMVKIDQVFQSKSTGFFDISLD